MTKERVILKRGIVNRFTFIELSRQLIPVNDKYGNLEENIVILAIVENELPSKVVTGEHGWTLYSIKKSRLLSAIFIFKEWQLREAEACYNKLYGEIQKYQI